MATPLRLLLVEDNPSDAELVLHTLRRADYAPIAERVETEQEFLDHLQPAPEIILADFTMPEFGSLRALEILQERRLDIPFIIVSGTIGEERAVQVMQHGATDYIIKDRLERLGLAVKQALARWQLEAQYRQSQKMEVVGQLAAGVAHDFNNLLTIILGYSELRLDVMPAADPGREAMEQIRNAGRRAAALTRQLLAFGRKQILAPVVLDLNSLLIDIEKMLRRLVSADIELITLPQHGLGTVIADPGQIEQVIINLVVNARDAMPTGGRLTIQTANTVLSESQVRQHPELQPGPFTMLSVSDTGCGMAAATKARIFEPFFTTKEIGKGTGLGLATTFGVIKQSGGFIEVDSALGTGSTFRVYLPQMGEAVQLQEANRDLVKMSQGVETILLVEDEDDVRELAKRLLEMCGYKVLSARNGAEAVRVCYEYPEVIHLLFTDVVMPKMSGRQLTESVIASRPDMKVLYMSGYSDDTMVRHGIPDKGANFLPKPFTQVALARKVRAVLDGTNA